MLKRKIRRVRSCSKRRYSGQEWKVVEERSQIMIVIGLKRTLYPGPPISLSANPGILVDLASWQAFRYRTWNGQQPNAGKVDKVYGHRLELSL